MTSVSASRLPFLLPWVRVTLPIRSIQARVWDDATWPTVKVALRRALEMRSQIRREGWWNWVLAGAGSGCAGRRAGPRDGARAGARSLLAR